jgi:tRNA(fMet)-specific endonuclease VapC
MTCWILDTDCLTLFQNGEPRICDRVSSMSFDQIATTIVTAEEQIRGRLNQVRRAQTTRNVSRAYSLL